MAERRGLPRLRRQRSNQFRETRGRVWAPPAAGIRRPRQAVSADCRIAGKFMRTSFRRLPGISVIQCLAGRVGSRPHSPRDRLAGRRRDQPGDGRQSSHPRPVRGRTSLRKGKSPAPCQCICAAANPSLPPRPELRTDVIDDWNGTLAHLPRDSPIKSRRIDHDGEVRDASRPPPESILTELQILGKWLIISVMPTTARSLASITVSHPAARMRSPPAPKNSNCEACVVSGALPRWDGAEPRRHTSWSGHSPPQSFDQLRAIRVTRSFPARR